jgi:hypothetical protein
MILWSSTMTDTFFFCHPCFKVDVSSGGGGGRVGQDTLFSHFLSFLPITKIQRKQIANFRTLTSLTLPILLKPIHLPLLNQNTMAKGKNHDRKANPGFGKTNGKANASSAGGEFTLKRVKG